MRKIYFIIFLFSYAVYSQSYFVKTGKNFTSYEFINSEGVPSKGFQTDSGTNFQIGYSFQLNENKRLSYELFASLNQFNAQVGHVGVPIIKYNTEFIGIGNVITFSLIKSRGFSFDTRAGFSANQIVYGKQEADGKIIDIKDFKEFNRVMALGSFGIQAKFKILNNAFVSAGYDYQFDVFDSNAFTKNSGRLKNSTLFIRNGQFQLGVFLSTK